MLRILAILLLLAGACSLAFSGDFECDFSPWPMLPTCNVKNTTTISSPDSRFRAPRNKTVTWISFTNNSNIEYLPERLYLSFPNLNSYFARNCSIKEISDANFVNLPHITLIDVSLNFIESIPSQAFDGLVKLSLIYLSESTEKAHGKF